jgi:hypothetical protein
MSEQTTENVAPIDWTPLLTAAEWAMIMASLRQTRDDFLCIGPSYVQKLVTA